MIEILNMLGGWFSGLCTIFVGIVAIWIALRTQKLKLKIYVGLRIQIGAGFKKEYLVFHTTNLSENPVTITSVGWRAGRRKRKLRTAIQLLDDSSPDRYPKKLEYGESAMFYSIFSRDERWVTDFRTKVVADESVDSLRAEFHTSIGSTKRVKPEDNFLNILKSTA